MRYVWIRIISIIGNLVLVIVVVIIIIIPFLTSPVLLYSTNVAGAEQMPETNQIELNRVSDRPAVH